LLGFMHIGPVDRRTPPAPVLLQMRVTEYANHLPTGIVLPMTIQKSGGARSG